MLNIWSIVDKSNSDVHRLNWIVKISSILLDELQEEFISRDDHFIEEQRDRAETDRAEDKSIARTKACLVVFHRSPDPSLQRRSR